MKNLLLLNIYRQPKIELQLYGMIGNNENGVFAFKSPVDDKVLRVIASRGDGWEHVSVSKINKTPTWREMEFIKHKFFEADEVCMQLHVAEAEHISFHDYCLHLWRPTTIAIPLPPAWMVGPKKEEPA
jgi:hypothetical protein